MEWCEDIDACCWNVKTSINRQSVNVVRFLCLLNFSEPKRCTYSQLFLTLRMFQDTFFSRGLWTNLYTHWFSWSHIQILLLNFNYKFELKKKKQTKWRTMVGVRSQMSIIQDLNSTQLLISDITFWELQFYVSKWIPMFSKWLKKYILRCVKYTSWYIWSPSILTTIRHKKMHWS